MQCFFVHCCVLGLFGHNRHHDGFIDEVLVGSQHPPTGSGACPWGHAAGWQPAQPPEAGARLYFTNGSAAQHSYVLISDIFFLNAKLHVPPPQKFVQ